MTKKNTTPRSPIPRRTHRSKGPHPGVFRLKKDLIIAAGTEVLTAPSKVLRNGKHHELFITFGRDHVGSLVVDAATINCRPDLFEHLNTRPHE